MDINDLYNMNSSTEKSLMGMAGINPLTMITNMGNELEGLIRAELKNYYNSYKPKVYKRTNTSIEDIKVRTIARTGTGYELIIDLNSNHRSLFNGEDGNSLWLINAGFVSKGLESKLGTEVEHFTRFKGTNFINNAIEKFNKSNDMAVQISLTYNGKDVTSKEFSYGK